MATTLETDIQKLQLLQAAKFLRAYLECSNEIQAGIREMLDVLNDPETSEDDCDMTLFTLADALFPNPHDGKLGMELEESERFGAAYSDEMREAIDEMDREEAAFSERLREVMEQQGLTQLILAQKAGVGQSAISNMLNRQCRPQRRTVVRLADALRMNPQDLWPKFQAE